MSRASLTATMITALKAQVVRPIFLFDIEVQGGNTYLCSAPTNVVWNSITWLGNGLFQAIDNVQDIMDLKAISYTVHISGADSTIMSFVLGGGNQSKISTVYLALLDSNNAIVADPFIVLAGFFNMATITSDGVNPTIALTYESEFIKMKNVHERRYTPESQKAYFPTDKGFQYVIAAHDWTGFWGKAPLPKINKRGIRYSK